MAQTLTCPWCDRQNENNYNYVSLQPSFVFYPEPVLANCRNSSKRRKERSAACVVCVCVCVCVCVVFSQGIHRADMVLDFAPIFETLHRSETASFAPFCTRPRSNYRTFTKTGSGQTLGKLFQRDAISQRVVHEESGARRA